MAIASLSVVFLAAYTGMFTPEPKNGFNRIWLGELKPKSMAENSMPVISYIGRHDENLYFSSRTLNELYSCDRQLENFQRKKLNIPSNRKWANYSSYFISNDGLYCWAPQVPALYKLSLKNSSYLEKISIPYPFSRAVMINPNSLIIRSSDPTDSIIDQVFLKYSSKNGIIAKRLDISPIYNDAGIVTNGQLHFAEDQAKIFYIHTFSNQIVWLDTNLNVTGRTTTIDTFNHFNASAEVYRINKTEKKASFKVPPKAVNLSNASYKDYLINYSAKKADNEDDDGQFNNLDVYSLNDGRYLGSLKAPYINGEKLRDFSIVDDQIIAIYKNSIVLFDLNSENWK